ncbi:MAG: thiosulfate oxidation carrier protein SoxY [Helicobacteraceae bacterium]|nr:thiosulfate oxidation carrier protein SoxY [Helicobacteraceae bacterium]
MLRREFFKTLGVVAAATAVVPSMSFAAGAAPKGPNEMSYEAALKAVTNGKGATPSDKVSLKVPEIAENGAVVPVTVEVDSPMTEKDYVKTIHVFATKNNNSRCAAVHLTPANGKAMFSSRIKLGQTQDVAAIVEMSDGSFLSAAQSVKVTIGGCG